MKNLKLIFGVAGLLSIAALAFSDSKIQFGLIKFVDAPIKDLIEHGQYVIKYENVKSKPHCKSTTCERYTSGVLKDCTKFQVSSIVDNGVVSDLIAASEDAYGCYRSLPVVKDIVGNTKPDVIIKNENLIVGGTQGYEAYWNTGKYAASMGALCPLNMKDIRFSACKIFQYNGTICYNKADCDLSALAKKPQYAY